MRYLTSALIGLISFPLIAFANPEIPREEQSEKVTKIALWYYKNTPHQGHFYVKDDCMDSVRGWYRAVNYEQNNLTGEKTPEEAYKEFLSACDSTIKKMKGKRAV
jgi:hypothetical protein